MCLTSYEETRSIHKERWFEFHRLQFFGTSGIAYFDFQLAFYLPTNASKSIFFLCANPQTFQAPVDYLKQRPKHVCSIPQFSSPFTFSDHSQSNCFSMQQSIGFTPFNRMAKPYVQNSTQPLSFNLFRLWKQCSDFNDTNSCNHLQQHLCIFWYSKGRCMLCNHCKQRCIQRAAILTASTSPAVCSLIGCVVKCSIEISTVCGG